MNYTDEEWGWIKEHLTEGCSAQFYYSGGTNPYPITINPDLTANFYPKGTNRNWDILNQATVDSILWRVVDFKWPDGTDMVPFSDYSGEAPSPVVRKVKSLQRRFANKSLPKVKATPLPFPH